MTEAHKRWDSTRGLEIARPDVDAFLREVWALCEKHGFALSHEDRHGAFEVVPLARGDFNWLFDASVSADPVVGSEPLTLQNESPQAVHYEFNGKVHDLSPGASKIHGDRRRR